MPKYKQLIFIDDGGSKSFRKKYAAKIRQTIDKNNRRMVEFRPVDSKPQIDGIQFVG